MSRVGLKPIELSESVSVNIAGNVVSVAGPLGKLEVILPKNIEACIENKQVKITRKAESKMLRSLHGLTRALLANAIMGVEKGFEKRLEITGVGFRAEVAEGGLRLSLGFSHPVDYHAPEGIKLAVEKNQIAISGIDKQKVGQVAAEIRALKKPEPYKGKGIKYLGEVIHLKPGKAAKAVGAPGAAA